MTKRVIKAEVATDKEQLRSPVMEPNMNPVLKKGESLESKVTVTLTQRDILLLNLCLQLVEQHHTNSGSLHFDIQSLRDRLSREFKESR